MKDYFQYLISFDLLSAKERLPNALNDACRLLFKEKTIIQSKMRTVYETSLLSLLSLFLFSFITSLRWKSLSCDINLLHVPCITLINGYSIQNNTNIKIQYTTTLSFVYCIPPPISFYFYFCIILNTVTVYSILT